MRTSIVKNSQYFCSHAKHTGKQTVGIIRRAAMQGQGGWNRRPSHGDGGWHLAASNQNRGFEALKKHEAMEEYNAATRHCIHWKAKSQKANVCSLQTSLEKNWKVEYHWFLVVCFNHLSVFSLTQMHLFVHSYFKLIAYPEHNMSFAAGFLFCLHSTHGAQMNKLSECIIFYDLSRQEGANLRVSSMVKFT